MIIVVFVVYTSYFSFRIVFKSVGSINLKTEKMKKKLLTFIGLFICIVSIAQHTEYYQTAFNKNDDSLKFELNQIIKGHVEFGYTSSSTDVWDILKETDRDTLNADNVIMLYSGRSIDAEKEYDDGAGWNREHVWAKSRGDFGTGNGAGTDVHHLRACDISVNSTRNNRNFDDCIDCQDVIDEGIDTGSKYDATLWTFEPRDEVKGDVARMIFYMVVRYEGENGEPDLELTNTLLSNTDKSPLQGVWNTLLEWNRIDTVSDWERNRNDIIYTDYQKNRNPFIDYPELAEYLFGDKVGYRWDPLSPPTTIAAVDENKFNIYPNPTNGIVNIQGEYERVMLYNNQGQLVLVNERKENISLSNLPVGLYHSKIICRDNTVVNKRVIKK